MIGGMLDELGRARGARSGGVGDGERVKAAETRGGSGDGVAAEVREAAFLFPWRVRQADASTEKNT